MLHIVLAYFDLIKNSNLPPAKVPMLIFVPLNGLDDLLDIGTTYNGEVYKII